MPLSAIVVIVLRLFAIQTLIKSADLALSITASLAKGPSSPQAYWSYLAPVGLVVFALLEWVLAPAISRLVTRSYKGELSLGPLSRVDLYSFAFVFLGLYFILSSIAPSLTWLHYFFAVSATGDDLASRRSFYDLAAPLIQLIAGVFALVFARRWVRRLIEAERDNA